MTFEIGRVCLPVFARHETFHPRYGWIRKGYLATAKNSQVFARPDAPVVLGVGKNMVAAIRYWAQAFKVIAEMPRERGSRATSYATTAFGTALFGGDGLDRYTEMDGTLWLLLWMLLRPPCLVPAWWVLLNARDLRGIDEDHGTARVIQAVESGLVREVVAASVRKDISCFLRTFGSRREGRATWEDVLDSPFRELRLVQRVSNDSSQFQFIEMERSTLPPEILAVAAIDYIGLAADGGRSMSVNRLAADTGSPGRIFRISRESLSSKLADAAKVIDGLAVIDLAGEQQLVLGRGPIDIASDLLTRYYGRLSAWTPAEQSSDDQSLIANMVAP